MAGRLQVKLPYQRDLNSVKIPNASLYFYDSGTDKLSTIYADSGLTVTLSNPVTADSDGDFVNIYLTASSLYKIILKDGNGVTVWTADNDQPSLNTTIIPITNSGNSQVFWIEGATAVGDKLIFNSTNVPTLSEASLSSNTAIENKTEIDLSIVSGQSYPLTEIQVTSATDPNFAVDDKIYFTYSGVDAYYKVTAVGTNSIEINELDTVSRSGQSAINSAGTYVFSAGNNYNAASSISNGLFGAASVVGTAKSSGYDSLYHGSDYALAAYGSNGVDYYTRSGSTFTKTTPTGLPSTVFNLNGNGDGSRVSLYDDSANTLKVFSKSGNTFSAVTINDGSASFARVNYITDNGTYLVGHTIVSAKIYVWKWNGSAYDFHGDTGSVPISSADGSIAITEDGQYVVARRSGNLLNLYKFDNVDTYNEVDSSGGLFSKFFTSFSGYFYNGNELFEIDTDNDEFNTLDTLITNDSVFSSSPTFNYCVNDDCDLMQAVNQSTITVSSSIASEPDSGVKPAVPSSATTREYNAGTNISSIQIQTKFTGNKPTIDGATTSTSLVSDNSGIIAGDEIFLSTDSSTVNRYTAGTTTVVISGGKAVYTTDITSAGLSTAPTLLYTGNINSYSSVQSSSGSPSYTLDTESTYTLDGDDIEITYTARSVSGSYVQLKTEFDYITSLNKFYAGLNT